MIVFSLAKLFNSFSLQATTDITHITFLGRNLRYIDLCAIIIQKFFPLKIQIYLLNINSICHSLSQILKKNYKQNKNYY